MIEFNFDQTNSTLHCIFDGRMDSPTSMEVEKEIQKKLSEVSSATTGKLRITFNLSKVDYIASAFIRICLQTAKLTERGNFSVCNTSPFVMKIFKMAGLDQELNVS